MPDADLLLHNDTAYPYLLGEEYVYELQRIEQLAKDGLQTVLESRTC